MCCDRMTLLPPVGSLPKLFPLNNTAEVSARCERVAWITTVNRILGTTSGVQVRYGDASEAGLESEMGEGMVPCWLNPVNKIGPLHSGKPLPLMR